MNATRLLRASPVGRTPMIQFLGKRTTPQSIDHTPRPHPQAPTNKLPTSFAEYRQKAQQHGPLAYKTNTAARSSVQPSEGQAFDRSDLPERFWRLALSKEEMDVIESGGAFA
ncbi:uncharacterized protein LAJ45_05398 [Morchella importuna]|uniref:Ribosomal protein S36, mitochondrial n=1 Tax=Morchella conica CCBAS932 TaxID=1392247 RepID=A0A3N4KPZ6_9PEZI|nr:uncharacterized protein LAJ45_05398 [Morchella importuna]KAH8150702.1 hypothetical protein LAJ45_05398 [Morchella importuna]RPB07845.1 hypothetical protein P167DRAFT_578896 [Morchella conica CCBAS932]